MPIITSKYATDGYKLSMGNIFWWLNMIQGNNIQGRYTFVDRDQYAFPPGFVDELKDEIDSLEGLSSNPAIFNYVSSKWGFINREFLRWYDQVFFHDVSLVDVCQNGSELRLTIEGPIHIASQFEIPILRIISSLKTKYSDRDPKPFWKKDALERAKFLQQHGVRYSEFGGRRPFNPQIHRESLAEFSKFPKIEGGGGLIGTSWVEYAYDFDLMIMGTMAHEYIEMMAARFGYPQANHMAMQTWVDYYGKCLGYYLPDTYTTPVAFRDFSYKFAHIFSGLRHDSGDPKLFADMAIGHYQANGIDPRTKSLIYSNSLRTLEEIDDLNHYRQNEINRSFGLGGFITNNVGYDPYNMVIKLVAVKEGDGKWVDVVKLSDDSGKNVGLPQEAAYCKKNLGLD